MGLNERKKIEIPMCENSVERQSELYGSGCILSSEPSEECQQTVIPPIVPCFNGKSLKIHEELVLNGLSAISIRHNKGNCKDERRPSEDKSTGKKKSTKSEDENKETPEPKKLSNWCYTDCLKINTDVPDCLKDQMKRRNSFWNLHRPELSKLTWPDNFVSSAVLQDFFHNHMRIHGTFCEPLHEFFHHFSIFDEEIRDFSKLREIVSPRILPPDEKVVTIMEKSRSVQLNDEDLDPQTMVHKSRAEFCVTIGEYIRRPPIKRTTSQQMPKFHVHPTNRFESLPLQHEGLLLKDSMLSEERVSAVVGSTDFFFQPTLGKKHTGKLMCGNISGIVLRRASMADTQRLIVTSPPSLNNFRDHRTDQVTEDSGDPARLRTILSPRDESAEESRSWRYRV